MDLPLLQCTQSSVSLTCPRLAWHVQDLLQPLFRGNFSLCIENSLLSGGVFIPQPILSVLWFPEVCAALERAEVRSNVHLMI